jgi:hypothetical protein
MNISITIGVILVSLYKHSNQPKLDVAMSKQLLDTAAKHPFSLTAVLDSAWNTVSENILNTGWAPVTRLAQAAVVAQVFLFFS